MTTGQRLSPRALTPSTSNAEIMATVDGVVAHVELSVPGILLPAGSDASDVPAGTPIRTIIFVEA